MTNMTSKPTIVSAFISNINITKHKNVERYINDGIKLLEMDVQKIIFIEQNIYDNYLSHLKFPSTHFIFYEKKDMYLYNHIHKITNFSINTTCQDKDTIEYMFVQCNKTEWIKHAIVESNYFSSEQFIWIDFGIFHVFNNDVELFKTSITNLEHTSYDDNVVRIASIWNLDITYILNLHQDVAWYFAGGVFGGNKLALLKFADLMKNKCLSFIDEHASIVWEVNLWYMIFKENKELFNYYQSNHNSSIIENY